MNPTLAPPTTDEPLWTTTRAIGKPPSLPPRAAKTLEARRAFLSAAQAPKVRSLSSKQRKLSDICAAILGEAPAGDQVTFLHSAFCQVGLPRSKPEGTAFERRSGRAGLRLEAGVLWDGSDFIRPGLPYGTRPRLVLLHLMRCYLRTNHRQIDLGGSARHFLMNTLGVSASGGENGSLTIYKQQIMALAACRLTIGYVVPSEVPQTLRTDGWISAFEGWPERNGAEVMPHERVPWRGSITLSEEFAASIRESAVPLDVRALRGLQTSALSLDVYAWLAQRLHRLERPSRLTWASLREQFGQEFEDSRNFKRTFLKSLGDVLTVYPQAKVDSVFGGIRLTPSPPPVRMKPT